MTKAEKKYKIFWDNFWKSHWVHGKTVEWWVAMLIHSPSVGHASTFNAALFKLVYDKLINEEQRISIITMLKSPLEEDVYTAVSIVKAIVPKRFKKNNYVQKRNE